MAERKVEFAYTHRESVRWLLEEAVPEYRLDHDVVFGHVKEMQDHGWDGVAIVDQCANLPSYVLPGQMNLSLAQMVYHDHPVLVENSDEFLRASLYRMAAMHVAGAVSNLFHAYIDSGESYTDNDRERYRKDSKAMQEFMTRLSTPATTPSPGQKR